MYSLSKIFYTHPPIEALESEPMITPPLYFTATMVVCQKRAQFLIYCI